jgi:lysine-N-methylase
MALTIRTLPILEHGDCQQCGQCCRGSVVRLDEDDLARLREQHWEEQPEFRDVQTVASQGLFNKTYTLVQKRDGSCVFLTAEGRCRIHELHGSEGKPRICRLFPLQLVPLNGVALLTMRRSCPSAAADVGRPVTKHLAEGRPFLSPAESEPAPPTILRGLRRDWCDARLVAGALERLMTDRRYPLVRRWIHVLQFSRLLSDCKLRKLKSLDSKALGELVEVLESAALDDAGDWFSDRQPPAAAMAVLFRQTAGEYSRLHPRSLVRATWRERLGVARTAMKLVRGHGPLPCLIDGFPAASFSDLERPLGALDPKMLVPLDGYFESFIASWRYATLGYGHWSLIDGIRASALSYAVALWLWRWSSGPEGLRPEEIIPIIGCLDRGMGYGPLLGGRHRHRVATIARDGQLERLVAWYAR